MPTRRPRGPRARSTRGRGQRTHFVLDAKTDRIEVVEPEDYARKLGLLGDWEEVVC